MGRMKDVYIELVERRARVLEDAGVPPDEAYELAGEQAYASLREHMADKADMARQLKKEEELLK